MKMDYKQRDQARALYTDNDYSINELEIKFNQKMSDFVIQPWRKMSDFVIQPWRIRQKEAHQIAKQQREAKALALSQKIRRQREKALKLEEKERRYKLRKNEVKKVKAISKKIRQFDLKSVVINIKQCPVNRYLMRS